MTAIYTITSPTGRVYIGQSHSVETRFKQYRNGWGNKQPALHASFSKHGIDSHSFSVAHQFPSDVPQSVLDRYEQTYWQCYLEAGVRVLNTREPGNGGRHSLETRQKMSALQVGRVLSPVTRQKLRLKSLEYHRLNPRTEADNAAISRRNKGLGSKAVMEYLCGVPVTEYISVSEAALKAGITKGAMSMRISSGSVVGGLSWSFKLQPHD